MIVENLNSNERESKKLHELVYEEKFKVEKVLSQSSEYILNFNEDTPFGKNFTRKKAGYKNCIFLEVSSIERDIPVENLIFKGYSSVNSGDYILAKIPRHEIERDIERFFYYDRDYKSKEVAIELNILSKDDFDSVLRTERAINYDKFMDK